MKLLSIPIEVIASFDKDGVPSPLRFKISKETPPVVIKVDKIISKDFQQMGRNKIYIFRCQSIIDHLAKIYELKFDVANCRWTLFRM